MDFFNDNDIRDYIVNKVFINDKINEDDIRKFYNVIQTNKNLYAHVLKVMYAASYMYTYFAYTKFPDDDELIRCMNFLNSIKSEDDLIKKMDFNNFKELCSDTVNYQLMDPYLKRDYVSKSLSKKKQILLINNNFTTDIKETLKKPDIYSVFNYYIRNLNKYGHEEAIDYTLDYLIKLEDGDFDSYYEILKEMMEIYFKYTKYCPGIQLDEEQSDMLSMIENNVDNLVSYSINNKSILSVLLNGFISYELLPRDKKEEIDELVNNQNTYKVVTPVNVLRNTLKAKFGDLKTDVKYYEEELRNLKDDSNFDSYLDILYVDNLVASYLFRNEDGGRRFNFMNAITSTSEYKNHLLNNDYELLSDISNSIRFNEIPFIDRKQIVSDMINDDIYKSSISKLYLFDIIENCRHFDVKDAYGIYDNMYNGIKKDAYSNLDKAYIINESVQHLSYILYRLKEIDMNNYNEIIYKIFEIVYEYFTYLKDKYQKIDKEYYIIIDKMRKNLDEFCDSITDSSLFESALTYFYEFYSLKQIDKFMVDSNYRLKRKGKDTIKFDKKNKNSD